MACLSDDVDIGVAEAVCRLVDLDEFRGLSGAGRDEAFMAVERELRRLQALQAAMVGEVRRSCSYVDDFHRNVTSWVRAVSNCAGSTASARVGVAVMFDDLPVLAAAVADGGVGADQVRLLAGLHANERCRSWLPEFESMLVGHARSLTYREFRQVCQRFEQHADPDGRHRDHERWRATRSVSYAQVGAGHVINIHGDALTGDILSEILDAHTAAELDTDLAERRARCGDGSSEPLARTAGQRRYDALVTIFLKAAATTTITDRVPLVNIFCTEASLTDAIRDSCGAPCPTARLADLRLPYAETASGAPVDAHDLLVAAWIGQVRRVVVDSVGRVIDLGRRSRLFTGAAREAVLLAGDTCDHPGCDRRGQIQIDHLTPWAYLAGHTNSTNGGPGCGPHNRAKHDGRITVTRDHTGWHHYRPDGTEIAPRNH